jgi:hypothetical protein
MRSSVGCGVDGDGSNESDGTLDDTSSEVVRETSGIHSTTSIVKYLVEGGPARTAKTIVNPANRLATIVGRTLAEGRGNRKGHTMLKRAEQANGA